MCIHVWWHVCRSDPTGRKWHKRTHPAGCLLVGKHRLVHFPVRIAKSLKSVSTRSKTKYRRHRMKLWDVVRPQNKSQQWPWISLIRDPRDPICQIFSFAYFGFCSRIPRCNFTMLPKVRDRRNLSASTLDMWWYVMICHIIIILILYWCTWNIYQ